MEEENEEEKDEGYVCSIIAPGHIDTPRRLFIDSIHTIYPSIHLI